MHRVKQVRKKVINRNYKHTVIICQWTVLTEKYSINIQDISRNRDIQQTFPFTYSFLKKVLIRPFYLIFHLIFVAWAKYGEFSLVYRW